MKKIILKFIYRILAYYARKVIARKNPFIVAITGSVGKTSTKEAVFKVLHDKYGNDVRKNFGNLNAEIGIPLTVLGYEKLPNKFLWPIFLLFASFRTNPKEYPKYLVLEMGVEHANDIKYFCSIVKPDIAIITSTSPAHIVNFLNLEEYQLEKVSIIDCLKEGGRAIVNFDDDTLSKIKKDNVVSIAISNKSADYWAESIKLSLTGTEYRICKSGYKISIKSKLLGNQMVYAQMFALALADLMQMPLVEASKSLEKIASFPGRMKLIEGKKNTIIIDDTYNSNPASAKMAISLLDTIPYSYRKVVILGSMNELGEYEDEAHKEVAIFLKDKCDYAVFVGAKAAMMQESFGKKNSLIFENRQDLISKLDDVIKKDDLILIKASQNNNFLEEVVGELMKNPKDAKKMLVRQGSEWKSRK